MSQQMAPPPPVPPSSGPSASDPTTAGAAASQDTSGITSDTKISSLGDLKNKAPKLYKYMMESIAQNVCISMQRAQERLKAAMRQMGDRAPYQ